LKSLKLAVLNIKRIHKLNLNLNAGLASISDNPEKIKASKVYVPPSKRSRGYRKEELGTRVVVIRQPRGPDGTTGFKKRVV